MSTFLPQPIVGEGNNQKVSTRDAEVLEVMKELLLEVKKLNIHMLKITDMEVNDGDTRRQG